MPDEVDMSRFHGVSSLQPGEEPMAADPGPPAVVIDAGLVAQLKDMGFAQEGSRRAVYHTNNSGVEAAVAWIMDHMGEADFNDPFVVPGGAPKGEEQPAAGSGAQGATDDGLTNGEPK